MLIKHKSQNFNLTPYKFPLTIKGLMLKIIKNDGALLIFKKEKLTALHTLFCFYKLDLIYLNENKEVTKIRKNILPFKLFIPYSKAKYILELKTKNNIKVGDKLKF